MLDTLDKFSSSGLNPRRFQMKSIQYDDAHRTETISSADLANPAARSKVLSLPVTPTTPYIVQRHISGAEYCTHVLAHSGRVLALAICPSSHWLLQYKHVEHAGIRAWVEQFVQKAGLSGHVCFDFIVEEGTDKVFAIECNPRVSTAVACFRGMEEYGKALNVFLRDSKMESGVNAELITPSKNVKAQYWLYHEVLYELPRTLLSPTALFKRAMYIVRGEDALYDFPSDPWPFFAQNHLLIPQHLLWHLWNMRPWSSVDYNLGRLKD